MACVATVSDSTGTVYTNQISHGPLQGQPREDTHSAFEGKGG